MNWEKIINYLIPKESIAGLSLNDSGVRLFLFDHSEERPRKIIAQIEREFEEGIIVGGELKKPEALQSILEEMRSLPEIAKIKNLFVILSLSSGLVYHKIFDLPVVSSDNLTEAIDLNLKMISPIKFEEAYADCELDGATQCNDFRYRLAAVFSKKKLIEPYLEVLHHAGFLSLAVEFNGLSLWRLFKEAALLPPNGQGNCLLAFISSDGLDFNILNENGVQFNYFKNWPEAIRSFLGNTMADSISELSREDFFKIFSEETRRVYSFFSGRFQGKISCFHLLAPVYKPALEQIIAQQFGVSSSKIPLAFDFSPNFFAAAGAALRGLISRVEDTGISLMKVGTEEEYRKRRLLNFVSLWNKIIISSLALLVAAFIGVLIFFNVTVKNLQDNLANLNLKIDTAKFNELKNSATEVNKIIGPAVEAKKKVNDWTNFFDFWRAQEKDNGLKRLTVSSADFKVFYQGWTISEQAMLNLKNVIENSDYFSLADIPLQSIIKQKTGVGFNLSFKIDKLP